MKKNIYFICLIVGIFFQSFPTSAQYVHSFSGTTFPEKIGNFNFISPRQYDETGKDISVGYRTNSLVEITHYVYPSNGQDMKEHFDNYKKSLLSSKSKATLLTTEEITTKDISGKVSKFEFFDSFHSVDQMVYSYLYIYKTKGWFIMLRITCTTSDNSSKEKEINEYVANMPFPTIENK